MADPFGRPDGGRRRRPSSRCRASRRRSCRNDRPRPGGGGCDHDVSGVSDTRAASFWCVTPPATGNRGGARGDDPGPPGAARTSSGCAKAVEVARLQASPTCGLAREDRRGCRAGSAAGAADSLDPRIIVVRIASGATPDSRGSPAPGRQVPREPRRHPALSSACADNRPFLGRLAVSPRVVVATVLSVTCATRRGIASRRVVEVLHLIGARKSFIATHFQRRFLGWPAGQRLAAAAVVLFGLIGW